MGEVGWIGREGLEVERCLRVIVQLLEFFGAVFIDPQHFCFVPFEVCWEERESELRGLPGVERLSVELDDHCESIEN
jgi:hypothetical protein